MSAASPVLSPLRLSSGLTLPNRVVVPAMVTRLSGEDGHVNRDVRDRYVRFAEGEAGLVVVEAMAVHDAKSGPLLRVCSDAFLPGLRDLAAACHDASPSKIFPQIIHFLKVARSGWRQTIDSLSDGDLDGVVGAYAAAAARARAAGFDGVELHMAHAYTLSSFLSRLNPRRDAYGGTLENRLRLPTRVFAAVRREVGEGFPVGVRFVADEAIKDGYTAIEAAEIAERFARIGAAYVSLSAGGKFEDAVKRDGAPLYPYTGYSGDRCMPGAAYPDGANLHLAAHVRRHLRAAGLQTPVVGAGKIATRELAERALERGDVDLVGMARALLADPDLPRKWREGRDDEVVRCQYGNVCKALDESFRKVVCTLWPKGSLQAPRAPEGGPPARAPLAPSARYADGQIVVTWTAPDAAPYGFQLLRATGHDLLLHRASVRGRSLRFEDREITGGHTYRYALRPYDLAGRRGPVGPSVSVDVPLDEAP
ncbi:MAG: NADH:flavin oxidoreductase [Polyangiaceae bacterium]|nr:NADH:flavin oxidoreductase [Polyangiaceae bacterium]